MTIGPREARTPPIGSGHATTPRFVSGAEIAILLALLAVPAYAFFEWPRQIETVTLLCPWP
ncbi:MAG: hypothetical protein C0418_04800 [Coriobacteriaceae bacterium]|nr:hypothetical protein [Coriobacteriaceae bacterium]